MIFLNLPLWAKIAYLTSISVAVAAMFGTFSLWQVSTVLWTIACAIQHSNIILLEEVLFRDS